MAEPLEAISMYILLTQGDNKIGDEGCKYLARSRWGNLIELNLGT